MTARFHTAVAQHTLSVVPIRSLYTAPMEYFGFFIQSLKVSFTPHSFLSTQLVVMRALKRSHLPPFIYTSCTHFTHIESRIVLMCQAILPIVAKFHICKFRILSPFSFLGLQTFSQFTFPGFVVSFLVPRVWATHNIDLVYDSFGKNNNLTLVVRDAHEDRVDQLKCGYIREALGEPCMNLTSHLIHEVFHNQQLNLVWMWGACLGILQGGSQK